MIVKATLQRYQISLEVLRQWQQEVARVEAEEKEQMQQQDVVVASQSESDYEPSQSSSPSDSHGTVSAFTGKLRSHQTNQQDQPKTSHTLTPIEGEMIRRVMRSQSGAVQVVEATSAPSGRVDGRSLVMQLEDRTMWPELWRQLNPIWPLTAKTAFPLANSAMEAWVDMAQKEPIWILRIVQRFTYPEELLMKLSAKVFEAWTAVWRTECLYGRDDWQRMRARNYGEDEILEQCDVSNKFRFAQHTICALLYEKELKAPTGLEQGCDNGAQTRLERHLLALKTVAEYGEAYQKLPHTVDWRAVATYFNSAFEQGEQAPRGVNNVAGTTPLSLAVGAYTDAYGWEVRLNGGATRMTRKQDRRKREMSRRIEIQNVRGFKEESRGKWMSAWRRTPVRERRMDDPGNTCWIEGGSSQTASRVEKNVGQAVSAS
ncbi:hypothetical protein PF010_g15702 [Phytophthora fragariae]|uniref:Uncharacterized protein n=1 Tax=Phytophthora fragariae TaxID=53985 RepID=A0A6G0KU40_9STRA|nr:hypothetical protein PF010_g15702 [Phytophthora fragariae]